MASAASETGTKAESSATAAGRLERVISAKISENDYEQLVGIAEELYRAQVMKTRTTSELLRLVVSHLVDVFQHKEPSLSRASSGNFGSGLSREHLY